MPGTTTQHNRRPAASHVFSTPVVRPVERPTGAHIDDPRTW